jgi:hypothetical protein
MPTLSYVHQLFSLEQCQAYIHTLRWKDRPLQCPRCQSQDIDPWGNYTTAPNANVTGATVAGAPSMTSPIPCCIRVSDRCHTGFWQRFCCVSRVRLAASPGNWGSVSTQAIAGAGGCATPRYSMRCIGNSTAQLKPMTSITPLATRAKPKAVGRSRWAAREAFARSASPAEAISTKIGRRLLPGSVVRGSHHGQPECENHGRIGRYQRL